MSIESQKRIAIKIQSELKEVNDFLVSANNIIEVMLNSNGDIWIDTLERGMSKTSVTFSPDAAILLMSSIATYNGTIINKSNPLLKASLPWGQRFQAMIPPIVSAPVFTIRKHSSKRYSLDDYVPLRMPAEIANMLRDALSRRHNIIISGGTGSGKTTLGSAMLCELSMLCPDDRVIIMEDTSELMCHNSNKVNELATGGVSMRDLLAANLRMRPDRIILGETRGPEALDLLKSWNTGHPGGICTLHSNSALSALARFEQLTLEAQNINIAYLRSLISDAVDLIVHTERDSKIGPKVIQVVRVTGMTQDAKYETHTLYQASS